MNVIHIGNKVIAYTAHTAKTTFNQDSSKDKKELIITVSS